MDKLLIFNTKYKKQGGEDSNIQDELKFYKNYYDVSYFEVKNSKFNLYSILSLLVSNNFEINRKLSKELKTFKPKYVYVHNTWFNAGLGVFRIFSIQNIVPIVKIHNFRFECGRYFLIKNHIKSKSNCNMCSKDYKSNLFFNKYFKNSYIKSFFLILYSKRYFQILKNSNIKIVCLNNFQKQYLIKLGISKTKIHILENPISIPSKLPFYNYGSKYVVYAGILEESKGVYELCNSWKKVNNGINLYIVGTGSQKNILEDKYNFPNIKFLGFLSNKETIKLIKNARAVVTATKMYEVQPRLLIEASANSIPSIYPSFGGMDEYFPKDYELNFEQYNYDSLSKKIEILTDEKKLQKISAEVSKFIIEKLSPNSIRKKFEIISNL